MKLKIKDLLDARVSLNTLATTSLPAKAAYIVARNVRKIASELDAFEEARVALLKNYDVTTDKKGDAVFPSPEAKEKVDAEFEELLGTEVEVDIRTLKSTDFGSALIPPSVFVVLWWLVEEDGRKE